MKTNYENNLNNLNLLNYNTNINNFQNQNLNSFNLQNNPGQGPGLGRKSNKNIIKLRTSVYGNKSIDKNSNIKNKQENGIVKIINEENSMQNYKDSLLNSFNANMTNTFNETKLNLINAKIEKKLKNLLVQIGDVDFRTSVNNNDEHIIFSLEKYLADSVNNNNNSFKIRNNITNIEVREIIF